MNRHLRPWAGLGLCAGVLVGGYLLVPAPKVLARANAPREDASFAVARAPTTMASVRPPVPLQVAPHTAFFVEEPRQATTARLVAEAQENPNKTNDSATAAKALIEADGYRNVSALVRAPDGVWAGLAMRGTTEVAIRVDAGGSVSTQ